ncbi:hypothetical protein NDU88_007682 [Pleurodeles waltl]|uniref:Uncharacterized protein n=1 Tax=Pleurodeles waltl TaxID=8319 RepID=A0AAV7VSZ5_PLEWA|nr:hypothetical protein NDU88_007682 [Pleurodeles waltl]
MLFVASSKQPGERSHLRRSLLIPQSRSPIAGAPADQPGGSREYPDTGVRLQLHRPLPLLRVHRFAARSSASPDVQIGATYELPEAKELQENIMTNALTWGLVKISEPERFHRSKI